MKANEAPEKIYITPNVFRKWQNEAIDDESVEYVRTDAFIEKACEWLKDNIYHRVYECSDRLGFPTAKFIDDFKNFMKGE